MALLYKSAILDRLDSYTPQAERPDQNLQRELQAVGWIAPEMVLPRWLSSQRQNVRCRFSGHCLPAISARSSTKAPLLTAVSDAI